VNLQKLGVAAFVIMTEPFATQVDRVMAYQSADRELPVIKLPHPTQNIDADTMQKRAEYIADMAQKLLDGKWDA
jgi:hypothetical protein